MKYYLGVDGGGTKTAYALFDENGAVIAKTKTKGSNHENLDGSFDEACAIIEGGIEQVLESAKIEMSDLTGAFMGLAGVDHPFQRDALYSRLYEYGLRRFEIVNDGYIVTLAGAPGGVGIGLNFGTGTCCNSIDSRGSMLQLGGFAEYSGDKGNGYWIAARVFESIYRQLAVLAGSTAMTEIFCKKAGVNPTAEEFIPTVTRLETDADATVRQLTDTLFEAANTGDKQALDIVEEISVYASELLTAHVKRQVFDMDEIPVVLSGSMNTKTDNALLLRSMKEKAESLSGRKMNFIKLDCDPVVGCYNYLANNTIE